MNRRDFFKAAVVAPVALPSVVKAAVGRAYASGGWIGLDWAGLEPSVSVLYRNGYFVGDAPPETIFPRSLYERMVDVSLEDAARSFGLPLSVEAQMREHDLFDFGPNEAGQL